MSRIDAIAQLVADVQTEAQVDPLWIAEAGCGLAREAAALLPLLREWEQREREARAISLGASRRKESAETALLAHLRSTAPPVAAPTLPAGEVDEAEVERVAQWLWRSIGGSGPLSWFKPTAINLLRAGLRVERLP